MHNLFLKHSASDRSAAAGCLVKSAKVDAGSAPRAGCSRLVNSDDGGGSYQDHDLHHHIQRSSLPALDCATRPSTHQHQAASPQYVLS